MAEHGDQRQEKLFRLRQEVLAEYRRRGVIDAAAWQARFPDLADEIPAVLASLHALADGPALDPATVDLFPKGIGRYRLLERLGQGGMGTVYKAVDPELERVVAIKVPRLDKDNAELRKRFLREARAAAAIRHPHVCPIYDVGEHLGWPFVVMAYVEGQALSDRLRLGGRYQDPREAVVIAAQVARALDAVHQHGIVHRDLKPGNIMLDATGAAVLTDFGLARRGEDSDPLTPDGAVVGTPAYLAPEQARGDLAHIDARTDLYSLGVVLYQMLTGRPPFEGPVLALLSQIQYDPVPAPTRRGIVLEPTLEALVQKAMARRPGDRFQTAGELTAALTQWLAGVPPITPATPHLAGGPSAPAGLESSTQSQVVLSRRPWLIGLGLVGAVCAGLSAWAIWFREPEPSKQPETGLPPAKVPRRPSKLSEPELGIYRIDPKTSRPILHPNGKALNDEDVLRLTPSRHPDRFRYLLAIDGNGQATIEREPQPPSAAKGGWRSQKRSPSTQTFLLLVTKDLWPKPRMAGLAAEISRLARQPILPPACQLVWAKGKCALRSRDSKRGEKPLPSWAGQVVSLLNQQQGLRFEGRTLAVQESGHTLTFSQPGTRVGDAFALNKEQPHIPLTTTSQLKVEFPQTFQGAAFQVVKVKAIVQLVHPHLNQVKMQLRGPDGLAILLLNNRTDAAGKDGKWGVADGANMGISKDPNEVGTIFDPGALLSIADPKAEAPYLGRYLPEGGTMKALLGSSPARCSGQWQLQITDFRNDGGPPANQHLVKWSLVFTLKKPPG